MCFSCQWLFPATITKVLTYKESVGLGLLCQLLHREWLPDIVYESLQHARIDSKKDCGVFIWLLANNSAFIYLASQRIMLYLISLSHYIVRGPFDCDVKALDCLQELFLGNRDLMGLKHSQFRNFVC